VAEIWTMATLLLEWIKIASSFPLPEDEKITKALAHCDERPAPYVITDEKCAIFSNSVGKHSGMSGRMLGSVKARQLH
jgi:hypothetical protein